MLHAAWRPWLLVMLGVFLRSIGRPQTNFTFEDTLSQIGLGYLPLFLLGSVRRDYGGWRFRDPVGYWGAFALYPLPAATSIRRLSAYRPTGRTTSPVLPRTGTRTPTWRGHSTPGF